MANLQQCLVQNSVKSSRQRRRRRRRNRGKKTLTPLNNSIIQEFSLQRSVAGSNANNNTSFSSGIPGGSVVKPSTEVSEVKPNIEKSANNQSFAKFTANQTIDLCSDDNSNETLVYIFNGDDNKSHSVTSQHQNETLIDISEDVSEENEIIILPDDDDKPAKMQCSHTTSDECKPLGGEYPFVTPFESKSTCVTSCKNKPHESKYSYITPYENKQPDTQSSHSESSNAKPGNNRPVENKCPCITLHENKTFDAENNITILSSSDSKPSNDKPSVSKCPCITLHENKTHDIDSPNSKPPNAESPNNRPSKSSLLHSRPENQSPLDQPPEKKHCIEPPEYEQSNAATKPGNRSPPITKFETVVIDLSDDESVGDLNLKEKNDTNDEILVIATFNYTSKPNEPQGPNEPNEPNQFNQSNETNEPNKPNKPNQPIEPIEPNEPSQPNEPNEPNQPNEPNEPDQPNEPDESDEPDVVLLKKYPKKSNKEHIREQLTKLCNENRGNSSTEPPKELPMPHSRDLPTERPKESPIEESSSTLAKQESEDLAESSSGNSNPHIVKLRRRIKAKYFRKLIQYKKKMEVDLFDTIKYQHLLINNTLSGTELSSGIGGNVYINAPVYIPTSGLRPIMIDGSNVAFTSENQYKFSCKRLDICIKYFKEKGHKVTAFVPQFRVQSNQSDDPGLLDQLVRSGDVILTPSKVIDGKLIVPYDDRFIVQAAVLKGGVIISRDNYKDLLEENPTWAETIKYRTLAYTWVDDVLMFPSDPLGGIGPTLDEFLRFN